MLRAAEDITLTQDAVAAALAHLIGLLELKRAVVVFVACYEGYTHKT